MGDRLYRADGSRSRKGLGLGLRYVKAVVEAHGGEAEVERTFGEGAAFRIKGPCAMEKRKMKSYEKYLLFRFSDFPRRA